MATESAWVGVASTLMALGERVGFHDGVDPSARSLVAPGSDVRYERLDLLGEGGMGLVERVWDRDLMRELALKRLRPGLRKDARVVRQFLWEARVTAYLDHPNIVPLHDLGLAEDDQLYFTMKAVRGQSLEAMIRALGDGDPELSKTFTRQRRLRVFHQLLSAMAFAHSKGVLHRDLKPGNVMLGAHNEVLVMDWGLALPLPTPEGNELSSARPEGVLEGSSSGTPLYMSPEQARGEELDQRSDVYTLGVILYELIALRAPYQATTLDEVMEEVREAVVIPFKLLDPEVDASLAAVVERAMAPLQEDRYADVESFALDVERVIDGRTPEAEDANVMQRAARYYTSKNAGLARLRMIDVEMSFAATSFFGVFTGALLSGAVAWWGWASLVGCVVLGVPSAIRWWSAFRSPAPA